MFQCLYCMIYADTYGIIKYTSILQYDIYDSEIIILRKINLNKNYKYHILTSNIL